MTMTSQGLKNKNHDDPLQLSFCEKAREIYREGGGNRFSVIKSWMDEGMDINYQRKGHLTSPLYWVVYFGDHETLSYMLDHGADVHATMRDQKTLLMTAFLFSHYDCADLLMKAGADLNAKDHHGQDIFEQTCRRKEPTRSKAFNLLDKEVERRLRLAKEPPVTAHQKEFEKAAQCAHQLKEPLRVKTFTGFKKRSS